jgi:hypothetical protein
MVTVALLDVICQPCHVVNTNLDASPLEMFLNPKVSSLDPGVTPHGSGVKGIYKLGFECRILSNPNLLTHPNNSMLQRIPLGIWTRHC